MSRFNFFARSGNNDPYSDRAPLSPRIQVIADDIEAQPSAATATAAAAAPGTGGLRASAEMTERLTPSSRFLSRFRPTIPSFFTTASNTTAAANNNQPPPQGIPVPLPRPSSSHYSSDYSHIHSNPYTLSSTSYAYSSSLSSLSGTGPTNNHTNHTAPTDDDEDDIYNASPKSPEFRIRAQNLPSTRLHLPELERTWTQGSNGPPTRPGTGTREGGDGLVAEPAAAVVRERGHGRRHAERRRERDGHGHSRSRSGSGSGSGRSGGRERRRRGHRRDGSGSGSRSRSGSGSGSRSGSSRSGSGESRRRRDRERRRRGHGSRGSESTRERRPPPKNFLFCFPWIKSRRIRSQILRCFVSGTFLVLMLAVYLSLSLTKNISSREFTVLLILIILAVTIFFCHALVRLCMLVAKARKREQAVQQGRLAPEMLGIGSGAYAVPSEPIPVVLARDEEAAGIESEAVKSGPPAYGVWRESVRVDPNRLYWARNERAATVEDEYDSSSSSSGSGGQAPGTRSNIPRPPSYSSDDGVSYVVDARPRSIAPRSDSHPSQTGRGGPWI